MKNGSTQDIISAINDASAISKITGRPYNIEGQLGDHTKDNSGSITSAKAMTLYFFGDSSDDAAKEASKEWEKEFIEIVLNISANELEPLGLKAVPLATR